MYPLLVASVVGSNPQSLLKQTFPNRTNNAFYARAQGAPLLLTNELVQRRRRQAFLRSAISRAAAAANDPAPTSFLPFTDVNERLLRGPSPDIHEQCCLMAAGSGMSANDGTWVSTLSSSSHVTPVFDGKSCDPAPWTVSEIDVVHKY